MTGTYGPTDPHEAAATVLEALVSGVTMFDTGAFYGDEQTRNFSARPSRRTATPPCRPPRPASAASSGSGPSRFAQRPAACPRGVVAPTAHRPHRPVPPRPHRPYEERRTLMTKPTQARGALGAMFAGLALTVLATTASYIDRDTTHLLAEPYAPAIPPTPRHGSTRPSPPTWSSCPSSERSASSPGSRRPGPSRQANGGPAPPRPCCSCSAPVSDWPGC
jgi:hypothetical protein